LEHTAAFRPLVDHGARLDLKRKTGITGIYIAVWKATVGLWPLTELAEAGHLRNVDLSDNHDKHDKHDIWHCQGECRTQFCAREQKSEDEEREALRKLLQAIATSKLDRRSQEHVSREIREAVIAIHELADGERHVESVYSDAVKFVSLKACL
jgi:hypothetical protein